MASARSIVKDESRKDAPRRIIRIAIFRIDEHRDRAGRRNAGRIRASLTGPSTSIHLPQDPRANENGKRCFAVDVTNGGYDTAECSDKDSLACSGDSAPQDRPATILISVDKVDTDTRGTRGGFTTSSFVDGIERSRPPPSEGTSRGQYEQRAARGSERRSIEFLFFPRDRIPENHGYA